MWQYGQHQTKKQIKEKTERMKEPPVDVSQATLIAGFHHPKIMSHDDNYIRSYIEGFVFKLCSPNMY